MSPIGTSVAELKGLIKKDVQESKQLQAQIDQLRQDIKDGNLPTEGNVLGHVESESKSMSKELARRIEAIEDKPDKNAMDREYLQALNARQVAWDRQIMQIAQIADLVYEARKRNFRSDGGRDEFLETAQQLPKGGKARGYGTEPKKTSVLEPDAPSLTLKTPAVEHSAQPPPASGSAVHADPDEEPNTGYEHETHGGSDHDDAYDEDAYDGYEYGSRGEDDQEGEEEPEPDKSAWPLCYRILDVDPDTDPYYFQNMCKKYVNSASNQHV